MNESNEQRIGLSPLAQAFSEKLEDYCLGEPSAYVDGKVYPDPNHTELGSFFLKWIIRAIGETDDAPSVEITHALEERAPSSISLSRMFDAIELRPMSLAQYAEIDSGRTTPDILLMNLFREMSTVLLNEDLTDLNTKTITLINKAYPNCYNKLLKILEPTDTSLSSHEKQIIAKQALANTFISAVVACCPQKLSDVYNTQNAYVGWDMDIISVTKTTDIPTLNKKLTLIQINNPMTIETSYCVYGIKPDFKWGLTDLNISLEGKKYFDDLPFATLGELPFDRSRTFIYETILGSKGHTLTPEEQQTNLEREEKFQLYNYQDGQELTRYPRGITRDNLLEAPIAIKTAKDLELSVNQHYYTLISGRRLLIMSKQIIPKDSSEHINIDKAIKKLNVILNMKDVIDAYIQEGMNPDIKRREFVATTIDPSIHLIITNASQAVLNDIKLKLEEFADKVPLGCNFISMSSMPYDFMRYKKSYILIDNKKVIYVNSDGLHEDVTINNIELLIEKAHMLVPETSGRIFLNKRNIEELITSNGGHTPLSIPISKEELLHNMIASELKSLESEDQILDASSSIESISKHINSSIYLISEIQIAINNLLNLIVILPKDSLTKATIQDMLNNTILRFQSLEDTLLITQEPSVILGTISLLNTRIVRIANNFEQSQNTEDTFNALDELATLANAELMLNYLSFYLETNFNDNIETKLTLKNTIKELSSRPSLSADDLKEFIKSNNFYYIANQLQQLLAMEKKIPSGNVRIKSEFDDLQRQINANIISLETQLYCNKICDKAEKDLSTLNIFINDNCMVNSSIPEPIKKAIEEAQKAIADIRQEPTRAKTDKLLASPVMRLTEDCIGLSTCHKDDVSIMAGILKNMINTQLQPQKTSPSSSPLSFFANIGSQITASVSASTDAIKSSVNIFKGK